jgi:hypothetical protein
MAGDHMGSPLRTEDYPSLHSEPAFIADSKLALRLAVYGMGESRAVPARRSV